MLFVGWMIKELVSNFTSIDRKLFHSIGLLGIKIMIDHPMIVFIVSTGRRGSTLLDMVLGAYSKMFSAGEFESSPIVKTDFVEK